MSALPFVSVIVVTHSGRRHLPGCLGSLRRQTYPPDRFEVVVVANACRDGSADFVRAEHSWARLIELPVNHGFAGGNNAGIAAAQGELVALLNDDAAADPDWLTELVAALSDDPRLGGVAAKVVFADDPGRINSVGLELYHDGRAGDRGYRELDRGQYDTAVEVFGGCGNGVLLRRSLLDALGGFDDRLFLYYEDVDLAWRARRNGWRFTYAPQAVVHHVHAATSGAGSPRFTFFVERNRTAVSVKNGPRRLAVVAVLGLAARVVRAGWRFVRRPNTTHWHMLIAHLRAAGSLTWLLPGLIADRWVPTVVSAGEVARWMRCPPRAA